MLSIIIASADPVLLQAVKANIAATVGVPYEILAFENGKAERGICAIYNEGIKKAQYGLLCFMHEDVAIKTANWGRIVQKIFSENPRLGIVGIAGSSYKSLTPSGWHCYSDIQTEYSRLIQSFRFTPNKELHHYSNPGGQTLPRTATVDGVWMCVKKEATARYRFDDATFPGFHCYDLDFCLQAGRSFEIAVTFDVLLHHYSDGNFDKAWMEQVLALHRKWKDFLPVCAQPFSAEQRQQLEEENLEHRLGQLKSLGFSSATVHRLLWECRYYKRFSLRTVLRFHRSIYKCFRQP